VCSLLLFVRPLISTSIMSSASKRRQSQNTTSRPGKKSKTATSSSKTFAAGSQDVDSQDNRGNQAVSNTSTGADLTSPLVPATPAPWCPLNLTISPIVPATHPPNFETSIPTFLATEFAQQGTTLCKSTFYVTSQVCRGDQHGPAGRNDLHATTGIWTQQSATATTNDSGMAIYNPVPVYGTTDAPLLSFPFSWEQTQDPSQTTQSAHIRSDTGSSMTLDPDATLVEATETSLSGLSNAAQTLLALPIPGVRDLLGQCMSQDIAILKHTAQNDIVTATSERAHSNIARSSNFTLVNKHPNLDCHGLRNARELDKMLEKFKNLNISNTNQAWKVAAPCLEIHQAQALDLMYRTVPKLRSLCAHHSDEFAVLKEATEKNVQIVESCQEYMALTFEEDVVSCWENSLDKLRHHLATSLLEKMREENAMVVMFGKTGKAWIDNIGSDLMSALMKRVSDLEVQVDLLVNASR
jgi:hypothetical protein